MTAAQALEIEVRGADEVEAAAQDVETALRSFVRACRAVRTVGRSVDGVVRIDAPIKDLRGPLIEAVDEALR